MKHTNKAGLLAALQLAIDALLDRASDYLDDDELDSVEYARNDEDAADILQSLHTSLADEGCSRTVLSSCPD